MSMIIHNYDKQLVYDKLALFDLEVWRNTCYEIEIFRFEVCMVDD